MSEIKTGTTRASMLKRLALLVGSGAVGAGVAARTMGGGGTTSVPAPAPAGRRTQELTFRGVDWRLARPGVEHGKLPTSTDVAVPVGRIVDVDQNELGRFRAAALPGLPAFHLHTFDLAEGTILGIGANRLDEGSFAVVGGTGLYAGATGTYTARQSPREWGGDGTAEFTLTLIGLEA